MKELISIQQNNEGECRLIIDDIESLKRAAAPIVQQILLEQPEAKIAEIFEFFKEVTSGLIALSDNPIHLSLQFSQETEKKQHAFEEVKKSGSAAWISLMQKMKS